MSKIFTKPFHPLPWESEPHDFTTVSGVHGLQLGPYAVETTQRYVWGTRYLMWDGRVFKYAKSISALKSYHLSGTEDDAPIGNVTSLGAALGSRSINVTMDGRSEDDLAGGYMYIFDTTIDNSVGRGIVGNDATSGTETIVHLDYPLAVEVTTSDGNTIFENPYMEIRSGDNYVTYMGVAASPVSASGNNFWLQTYGCCHVSGGETITKAASDNRDLVGGPGGCLWKLSSHDHWQRIGQQLTGSATMNEGPIIMLQLKIGRAHV